MCFLIYVLYDKYLQILQKIVHSRKETSILDKKINYLNKQVRSLADKNKLELREYRVGAQILSLLQINKIILLTNTKKRIIALDGFNIEIVDQRKI